jgi:hypothetical protein
MREYMALSTIDSRLTGIGDGLQVQLTYVLKLSCVGDSIGTAWSFKSQHRVASKHTYPRHQQLMLNTNYVEFKSQLTKARLLQQSIRYLSKLCRLLRLKHGHQPLLSRELKRYPWMPMTESHLGYERPTLVAYRIKAPLNSWNAAICYSTNNETVLN